VLDRPCPYVLTRGQGSASSNSSLARANSPIPFPSVHSPRGSQREWPKSPLSTNLTSTCAWLCSPQPHIRFLSACRTILDRQGTLRPQGRGARMPAEVALKMATAERLIDALSDRLSSLVRRFGGPRRPNHTRPLSCIQGGAATSQAPMPREDPFPASSQECAICDWESGTWIHGQEVITEPQYPGMFRLLP
jgi:hypothetical protein